VEQGTDDGDLFVISSHDTVKRERDLAFEIHLACADETESVSVKVDFVEVDVVSLDAVDYIAGTEAGIVDFFEGQYLQKRHHGTEFVDVGFGKMKLSSSAQGVDGIVVSREGKTSIHLAFQFVVSCEVGALFKLSIGQDDVGLKGGPVAELQCEGTAEITACELGIE